ncbi:MAG: hypothetical protein OEV21_03600 [Thermoplasmata archaeon]|nr:hypothetical protein [Thermoplasmata archaeon]
MVFMGYKKEQIAWIGIRIGLGWILFWAFLDKMFGLGFATDPANAWLAGGSPTSGYLAYASSGILGDFYAGLANNVVIDSLFMLGLFAIGLAMILGIGQKIAGYTGAILMILLWSTNLPPSNNPIIDDHIIYAILFLALTTVKAGQWLGLGKWWVNTPIVKKFPFLE